eukprot:c11050_g1_i3.p1 GENE.c11050_g1_i3~~c11050_g1_i3.p1  ORF type:complete len:337 (-),score=80.65 c11050_g1_i3:40-1050(-)
MASKSPEFQEAINKALLAVAADKNRDPRTAIRLYTEAIELINQLPPFGPENQKSPVEYASAYQKRIAELESQLATDLKSTSGSKKRQSFARPEFEVPFDSAQPDMEQLRFLEACPSGPARTYWLMRRLETTMNKGGFMTPVFYVPAHIWTQDGMKITAISAKVACCKFVLQRISVLKTFTLTDTSRLVQGLQGFLEEAVVHQNNLSRYLGFIDEQPAAPSLESGSMGRVGERLRSFGHFVSKTAIRLGTIPTVVPNSEGYTQLLMEVFRECQIFGVWLLQCVEKPSMPAVEQVHGLLIQISDFLYNVVCAFVLNDFSSLLDRYLKKSRQTFTRLFP